MQKLRLLGYYSIVALLLVWPLLAMLLIARSIPHSRIVVIMLVWFGVYTIFDWWWDPGYIKYWLVPLLCWWTLIGLALHEFARAGRWPRLVATVPVAICIVMTFAINFGATFRPHSDVRSNVWLTAARQLQTSDEHALFISTEQSPLDFYIAYFARRDVVSATLIRYGGNQNEELVSSVVAAHVAAHRAVGGPVYVYSGTGVWPSNEADDRLLARVGIQRSAPAWTVDQLVVYATTAHSVGLQAR
jgi:hypothetical protein